VVTRGSLADLVDTLSITPAPDEQEEPVISLNGVNGLPLARGCGTVRRLRSAVMVLRRIRPLRVPSRLAFSSEQQSEAGRACNLAASNQVNAELRSDLELAPPPGYLQK
jgi:hypothetical protein